MRGLIYETQNIKKLGREESIFEDSIKVKMENCLKGNGNRWFISAFLKLLEFSFKDILQGNLYSRVEFGYIRMNWVDLGVN